MPSVAALLCNTCSRVLALMLVQKPANWRLACQTLVGDGENSGSITIGTKPQ